MRQSITSKFIRLLVWTAVGISYAACQLKSDPQTVGDVLCNIKLNTFQGVFRLIFVVGYVSGFGLLVAAIFKLKQVKDNPTQIPVSTPIVLFLCAALSIFMPSLIAPAGESIFGSGAANSDVSSVEEVIEDGTRIGTPSITNLMEGN